MRRGRNKSRAQVFADTRGLSCGTQQWAWAGKPLNYWSKDQKAGDVTGDGFNNNTWHAVRPEPRPMTGSMSGP